MNKKSRFKNIITDFVTRVKNTLTSDWYKNLFVFLRGFFVVQKVRSYSRLIRDLQKEQNQAVLETKKVYKQKLKI